LGRRRKFGRPLNGVLVVDKAAGVTSNDVVQRAKRLFYANKAGHTGALDPLATGVLPLCFGESTKFSQYLLDADKGYVSTFCFGMTTATADADGEVTSQEDASKLTQAALERAIDAYRGDIEQVPPMYSALKRDGKPLYQLAREGIEVERDARPVTIYNFEILAFRPGVLAEADLRIDCSKGTYVRSLAEDIGRDLGVGAHVAKLRRVQAGPFLESQVVNLDDLESERGEQRAEVLDHYLLPVDSPVEEMPKLLLDEHSSFYFIRGQAVISNQVYRLGDEGDKVRVFDQDDGFLGVGEITDDGRVTPSRLIAQAGSQG